MSVPTAQHAIVQKEYGAAATVLKATSTHPVVGPVAGQVQVRVAAASLNPIDWQMIEGNRRLIARRIFPFVPLFDLAGVVTAVGEGVTRFKLGDRVHSDNEKDGGGAGEFVNVDQNLLNLIPRSLSFVEAAAVPLAAQTALLAVETAGVGPGSRVCIIGASGGVGTFAVQIAKVLGASRVVGVCSEGNRALVASLGADQTIDRTTGSYAAALGPQSIDAVIDCVGGRDQWIQARKVLVPAGRFATISRDEDGKVTVPSAIKLITTISARQARGRFGRRIGYLPVFLKASQDLLGRVDALIDEGKIKVHVGATLPLDLTGVLQGITLSKTGRAVGKIVFEAPFAPGVAVA